MTPEIITIFVSVAVLLLQIFQAVRYVRLESEVKRVTTQLDQTLNRLHRANELVGTVYASIIRYYRFYWPVLHQINQDGPKTFWKDQAKYQHAKAEAETNADMNRHTIELRAVASALRSTELMGLVNELGTWVDNPEGKTSVQIGELHRLIENIQQELYLLIDKQLSQSKHARPIQESEPPA